MPCLSLQAFLVYAPAFSFPSPALLQLSCLSSYCCSAASLLSSSCITFFCWTFFPFLSIFISLGHSVNNLSCCPEVPLFFAVISQYPCPDEYGLHYRLHLSLILSKSCQPPPPDIRRQITQDRKTLLIKLFIFSTC